MTALSPQDPRPGLRVDLYNVPTLGLSIMAAFAVVAPRYGVRFEGIEEDANEHSDFWQQIAAQIIAAEAPSGN